MNIFHRHGLYVLDWCYRCNSDGELSDHLFLHYKVAWLLWDTILGIFNMSWVMPSKVVVLIRALRKGIRLEDKKIFLEYYPRFVSCGAFGRKEKQ